MLNPKALQILFSYVARLLSLIWDETEEHTQQTQREGPTLTPCHAPD